MEIKLNARLCAYSKVDYVEKPECDHGSVSNEEIDSLFTDLEVPQAVTKEEIDDLFEESSEEIKTVSFKAIDSLFN